jgi:hypothetical protein
LKNAERIRDMRFARSNEYNPDVAIRAEREDLLSKTFYENKGNTDLAGLRGRLGLQLSRTGGSLSKKENKVTGFVNPKKKKKKKQSQQLGPSPKTSSPPPPPPPPSASMFGSLGAGMGSDELYEGSPFGTNTQYPTTKRNPPTSAPRGSSSKKRVKWGGYRLGGGTPNSSIPLSRYSRAAAMRRRGQTSEDGKITNHPIRNLTSKTQYTNIKERRALGIRDDARPSPQRTRSTGLRYRSKTKGTKSVRTPLPKRTKTVATTKTKTRETASPATSSAFGAGDFGLGL